MLITQLKLRYLKNPHTNKDNVLNIKFHNGSIYSNLLSEFAKRKFAMLRTCKTETTNVYSVLLI